jgi:Putative beta-barrel porin 2
LFSRYPLTFSIALDGGYDTNVNTTSGSKGSAFDDARGNVSFDAGTERWHLTITAVTDVVYFFQNATSPNPEVNTTFQLSGHYNVTERLTLNTNVMLAYQAEPDFSSNVGPNRRAGYFFTTTDLVSASYQWTPLISTVSSETFELVNYDNAAVGAFEDRIENTLDQQVLFHLSMRTALVAEYRFQDINYDTFPNDSTSNYFLGGIDQSFNPKVNMSLRGGVTFRSYTGGSTKTAPQFDGTLNYAIGRSSSLSWVTSYGLEAPDSPTVQNTTAFRTGLQLRYGITPRISYGVAAFYIHNDNQLFTMPGLPSADMTDDSYLVSLTLQYSMARHWAFHVGFDASGASSNSPGGDYSRQRYSAGLNFTF